MIQIPKKLRAVFFASAAVACAFLVLFAVHQLVLPVIAWIFPSLETPFYDLAVYGGYRTQDYVSYNLSSPRISQLRWDDECDNGFIFVTPQGKSVEHPGPMILNSQGNLVWMSAEFGVVMNLNMQEYKGQSYLTFWAGRKDGTFGSGAYYMVSRRSDIC